MRCRELVLCLGSGFVTERKCRPRLLVSGGFESGEGAHIGGKALVEPEVVPPAHGDEVSEPHMGHLVEDRLRAAHAHRVGHSRTEHIALEKRDAACVLHGSSRELGHKELVVLSEHVRLIELLLEEVEPLTCYLEDLIGVEVLCERLPAVEAEWNSAMVLVYGVVVPGDDGRQERKSPRLNH